MAEPQFIHTPNGEELVILGRADYDALVHAAGEADEDAADIALYDERIAGLAAGRDEALPEPVSVSLLRGDTRLKAIRKWRGVTQSDLALKVEIAQGYLSELEAGHKRGGADTLTRLAGALDVPAAWLAVEQEGAEAGREQHA